MWGKEREGVEERMLSHFVLRYGQRGIDKILDMKALLRSIEGAWTRGCVEYDRQGIEGPRIPCTGDAS